MRDATGVALENVVYKIKAIAKSEKYSWLSRIRKVVSMDSRRS